MEPFELTRATDMFASVQLLSRIRATSSPERSVLSGLAKTTAATGKVLKRGSDVAHGYCLSTAE
jgi:hypothetical protein